MSSDEVIITHAFAEKHLTKECLAFAKKTSRHYIWVTEKTSAAVYFELPQTFKADFYQLMPMLGSYCMPYMREAGLTENVLYATYLENCKKPDYTSKKGASVIKPKKKKKKNNKK